MKRKKDTAKARDEQRLREENSRKPKQQKKRKKRSVPKTVQKTLPYQMIVYDCIFRIDNSHFSKTYRFEDINYSIAKQEEQEAIFLGYCAVLNSLDTGADMQITVYNNRVNKAKFNDMVLLKRKGDGFDRYIDVYNQMLTDKMEQGQNGIIRSKFLTVTVQAADEDAARVKFSSIDVEIINAFKKLGSDIRPMTANERVTLLKDIFRGADVEIPELTEKDFRRKADRAYCCPDYLEFKKDYFMWGDKYARTMFIKDMPASLKDCLLTDILGTNLDVMVTVNVAPVDPYKKYIIADADSDGSAAIEIGQSVSDAVDTMIQTGGTIRTAVQKSATGIGKIYTMVKHGVQLGTAQDVGKVAANIGSGIRTGIVDLRFQQTGSGLLKTKIDKSTTTDTGTEAIKQGLTDLRYADNTRKALQNTARGSIKATRAIRNMPRETRAQVQRIRKRAQKTSQAAKQSADAVRRVLSTKAGRIIALGGLVVFLSVFLLNGLLTVIVSAAASLFSWLAPDGDTADTTMQNNIRTYISQIQGIEAEKQREVNGIANSLSPEYKYDGTQITGLNRFGNRTVQPYDNKAVLAVLAVQKFRTVQETGTANFTFTQDEIRTAVEQFFTLNYHYEYSWCPSCDCSKDSDCTLSLADGGFRISGTSYDSEDNSYNVTLTGPTYTHASSMSTKLDFRMNGGGSISGTAAADVGGGTWSVTYCIGADAYDHIDWSKCYLTVDTVYCNNPNHRYLYGQVVNLTEAQVMTKAGFTADEKQIFQAYLEQIRAIGG